MAFPDRTPPKFERSLATFDGSIKAIYQGFIDIFRFEVLCAIYITRKTSSRCFAKSEVYQTPPATDASDNLFCQCFTRSCHESPTSQPQIEDERAFRQRYKNTANSRGHQLRRDATDSVDDRAMYDTRM